MIKHLHERFNRQKLKQSWIMFIAPAFATVYNWMNLNVVVHPYVMHFVRDVQWSSIEAATPEIIDKVHDIILTDQWVKVREFVDRPQAYHMAQWFQFCMNNCVWKNYRQDGCRVYSL